MSKPIFKSKTFWANIIIFALYLLDYPQLSQIVPPQAAGAVAAILNIVLRFVTVQPVTL